MRPGRQDPHLGPGAMGGGARGPLKIILDIIFIKK